jgi:hypothetical protein
MKQKVQLFPGEAGDLVRDIMRELLWVAKRAQHVAQAPTMSLYKRLARNVVV